MKKLFTIFAIVLLNVGVFAQAPLRFSYQAIIRDGDNALVASTTIGMQISIMKRSSMGDMIPVYVETQTTTTNVNGLVTIEIGLYGDVAIIDMIDWSDGPYFLKTETDPTGGTNYTIIGTSQFLSVPYALHAKTAETLNTPYLSMENDPIYQDSQAANITYNDITKLGNLSGVNTGDQDGSETKLTAGTKISVTGSGTTASPYVINATATVAIPFAIGDSYGGGIIFWLDATGQHGLIAATADQSTGIRWWDGPMKYTGTEGDGLYAGVMNTAMIVALHMADNQTFTNNFAAKFCADYSVTDGGVTYGDWYLPSKYELNLLYTQKATVGGFADAIYWSSTEDHSYSACIQYFDTGATSGGSGSGKLQIFFVRAIRAF